VLLQRVPAYSQQVDLCLVGVGDDAAHKVLRGTRYIRQPVTNQPASAAFGEGKCQFLLEKQFSDLRFHVIVLHVRLHHHGLCLLTVERVPDLDKVVRTDVSRSFMADYPLRRQILGALACFQAGSDLPRGYFRNRKLLEINQVSALILQELEVAEVWLETLARADDQHGGLKQMLPLVPLTKTGLIAAEVIHPNQKGDLQTRANGLAQRGKRFGGEIGAIGSSCQVFFQAANADLQVWLSQFSENFISCQLAEVKTMFKSKRQRPLDHVLQVVMAEHRHQHYLCHLLTPGLQCAHCPGHKANMPGMDWIC